MPFSDRREWVAVFHFRILVKAFMLGIELEVMVITGMVSQVA